MLLYSCPVFAQLRYSNFHDPFDGGQEKALDFMLEQDTLYIRSQAICDGSPFLCSAVSVYAVDGNTFIRDQRLDQVQGGFSLLPGATDMLLPSEESAMNEAIRLNRIDRSTLHYIDGLDLSIPESRYFAYTVKRAASFGDRYAVGAQVLDSLHYVNYPGWYNYQENAVVFFVDQSCQLDTLIVLSPSSGAHLKIEDMYVGPDSVLYISFFEKYLNTSGSQPYLADRKVVYGFNDQLETVFEWVGPDMDLTDSWSCLAVGPDTTIYLNYRHDYRTYLVALQPDGAFKWECPLDSTIGLYMYNIRRLAMASNGDVVGVGSCSSVAGELGESGFIFRITPSGVLKSKKVIRINPGMDPLSLPGFPWRANIEDLVELPDGGLLLAGWVRKYVGETQPEEPYNFDIWLVRTDAEGCLWENCPDIQDVISKDKYFPVVTPLNEWVVDYTFPTFPTERRRYSFSADSSLIAGRYYLPLVYSQQMSGGPWQQTGAFFREEDGRVYAIGGALGQPERLVYDFHLGIGDTLPANPAFGQATRLIVGVNTVSFIDGIARKRILLDSECGNSEWIEGIGDLERLFEAETFCSLLGGVGPDLAIRCFSSGGQLRYKRADIDDCYTSSSTELSAATLLVYPNPVFDQLSIQHGEQTRGARQIRIFNSTGQALRMREDETGSISTIDVSGLTPGWYYGLADYPDAPPALFRFVKL